MLFSEQDVLDVCAMYVIADQLELHGQDSQSFWQDEATLPPNLRNATAIMRSRQVALITTPADTLPEADWDTQLSPWTLNPYGNYSCLVDSGDWQS